MQPTKEEIIFWGTIVAVWYAIGLMVVLYDISAGRKRGKIPEEYTLWDWAYSLIIVSGCGPIEVFCSSVSFAFKAIVKERTLRRAPLGVPNIPTNSPAPRKHKAWR